MKLSVIKDNRSVLLMINNVHIVWAQTVMTNERRNKRNVNDGFSVSQFCDDDERIAIFHVVSCANAT